MKRWMIGLVMVAWTATAMAANLDEGTKELRLDGGLDFDTAAGDQVALDTGLGYFVADNLELGALLGVLDNDLFTLWRLGGFGEVNFPLEDVRIVPFLGAGLALAYWEPDEGDSEDALVLGLSGGGKYFLTEDLAIALQLNFEYASEEIYAEDDDVSDTNWDITLGLRYYFDSVPASAP